MIVLGRGGFSAPDGPALNKELVLNDVDLRRGYLVGVHLEGANLRRSHLEGALLIRAHLEHAWLDDAHLEHADLRFAHLEHADLRFAHLERASLSETNLEGAELFGIRLDQARAVGCRWPDGFDWYSAGLSQNPRGVDGRVAPPADRSSWSSSSTEQAERNPGGATEPDLSTED